MKYRASLMGGSLFVRCDLEMGGTVVICSIPQNNALDIKHGNHTK